MGKLIKMMQNPHMEKKLPEFLTNHVSVKTIKKVSVQLSCQSKKKILDGTDGLVNIPKRKISSNEPPTLPESVTKVLHNPKLMTDILKKLDLPDVKNCRRVCQTWENLTTHILQTRRQIQISLVYSESRSMFLQPTTHFPDHPSHQEESHRKRKTLTSLIKCMETSRNFPCKNFRFVSGDLENPEVQQFFDLFGPDILELHLSFGRCQVDRDKTLTDTLRQLLLHQVPNVEHLVMSFVSYSSNLNDSKPLFPPGDVSVSLPNLRTLNLGLWFPTQRQIIKDILTAARKLEEFYHEDLVDSFLETVIDSHKIHTIQKTSFSLLPSSNLYFHQFSKFASTSPQLTDLEVYTKQGDWRVLKLAASILNNIFRSSQETLETLSLHPLGFISRHYNIHIPPLPRVQTLVMRTGNCTGQTPGKFADVKDESMFPRGMEGIFPNLRSVVVDLMTDQDSFWEFHFPPSKLKEDGNVVEFPLVKYLEIQRLATPFWIKCLSGMFPNVEDLKMTVDSADSSSYQDIYDCWPRLERFAQRIVNSHERLKPRVKL